VSPVRAGHGSSRRSAAFAAAATFAALAAFGGAAPVRAQTAEVTLSASSADVAVDEPFVIEVRADVTNGRAGGVELPGLDALEVRARRVVQPMTFSFGIGGQTATLQSTVVYTFEVVARRPGSLRLGPARVTVGGRTFQSAPLAVRVRPAGAPPAPGPGGPGAAAGGPGPGGGGLVGPGAVPGAGGVGLPPGAVPGVGGAPAGFSGDVGAEGPPAPPTGALGGPTDAARYAPEGFLRTVIDDAEPFVGAQVTVTVYLYVRAPLRASPVATREPSTDGFWTHDLLQGRPVQDTQQVVRGTLFHVYPLRRFAAFPLRAGELTIGAMRVEAQTGSVFAFFGPQPRAIVLEGVPLVVRVRDLPAEGRPAGPVHVGRFTLRASLDRASAQTGDAVTLTAVVEGAGNLREVRLPTPQVDGLDVLAPNVRDEPSAPGDLVGGRRVFEWLVVGTRAGRYTLGPLGFDAFDPQTARYTRVEAPALSLAVAGAPLTAGGTSAVGDPAPAPEADAAGGEGGPVGDDAPRHGPLRTTSALARHTAPLAERAWFVPALLAPPGLLALLLLGQLFARRARHAVAAGRPARAARDARRRLERAHALADAGDARAFYAEIGASLHALVDARLGEPTGGLTLADLRAHLVSRGMPEDLARRLVDELEGAEFARFSAAAVGPEEMREALARAAAIAERLLAFAPTRKEDA
jgi:hypothetical protein